MNIINQSYEILTDITGNELEQIELAARTCYKSQMKGDTKGFVQRLIDNNHEAMLEHSYLSVKFITDRAVANEIVRHRHFSFAQESTRYCKYKDGVTFIRPPFGLKSEKYVSWLTAMQKCEEMYLELLDLGASAQEARCVLPLSTKTELVVSGNYREWRHFFELRALGLSGPPHPMMVDLTFSLLEELQGLIPIIFDL